MLIKRARLRLSDTRNIAPLCLTIAVLAALAVCPRAATAQAVPASALAGSSSAPETDMVTVTPDSPKVTLPSGVTVSLVGVGLEEEDRWWSPTGTPIPAPVERRTRFHNISWGFSGDLSRLLAVELTTPSKLKASSFGYIVDPTGDFPKYGRFHRLDMRLNDGDLKPEGSSLGKISFAFPSQRHSFTYRFGLATGDWTTVATIKPTLHPAAGTVFQSKAGNLGGINISLNETPTIGYKNIDGRYYSQGLLPRGQKLGNEARRIIAMDDKGDPIVLDEGSWDNSGNASVSIPEEDYSRIAEFRVQTRPYAWVEFKDIAFNGARVPGMPVIGPDIAMPRILPQFHKSLPGGIGADLIAVAEPRTEGGQWWLPNGKLLDGPIKDLLYMSSVKAYPGRPGRPRAIALQITSVTDQDISTVTQWPGDIMRREAYDHQSYSQTVRAGMPSTSSDYLNYMPGVKSCMMRFGVATGPWKTIAKIPLDISQRMVLPRPLTPENDYQGDVNIWIKDQPTLGYTDPQGKVHQQLILGPTGHLGDNVARRFVAIMADGTIVPITSFAGGAAGTESISLTYNRHRQVHIYNPDLELSQVAEFRLQTRPYNWVKFTGIALDPKP